MAHVRTYNPSVRVGNWNEDIQLEEDVMKDFLQKKERGELLIQRMGNMTNSVLSPQSLSVAKDNQIAFGNIVMICCAEAKDQTQYSASDVPRKACSLSANPSEAELMKASAMPDCVISGSNLLTPNARNVFKIESVDGTTDGEPVCFSQPFQLRLASDIGGGLLLESDIGTFANLTKKTRQQLVCLSSKNSSFLNQWKIVSANPLVRFEMEGSPVPVSEKVVILHCKTNKALCVEKNGVSRSSFGPEYEISCHTCLDSHKAEEEQNLWNIKTASPDS